MAPQIEDAKIAVDMKLAIRTDRETGFVRAFVAALDGTDKMEIGAIALECLDGRDGPMFERWKLIMRDALGVAVKKVTGIDVAGWSGDIDPSDLEGKPQG